MVYCNDFVVVFYKVGCFKDWFYYVVVFLIYWLIVMVVIISKLIKR